MPSRNRQTPDDRARARRRARHAAQGIEADDEREDAAAAEGPAAGPARESFLTRLFPPAPPLPNRPDPLAGFTYTGPLRGLVASFWLLARSPTAWVATGAIWAVGRLLTAASPLGILASFVSFGGLIAAGWIGWRRPWLFGFMAALLGMAMYGGIWTALVLSSPNVPPDAPSATVLFVRTIAVEVIGLQPLFGIVAGWYGGYLRRRMSAASAGARRPSRRR